jgi:hypothetical protein
MERDARKLLGYHDMLIPGQFNDETDSSVDEMATIFIFLSIRKNDFIYPAQDYCGRT